MIVRAEEVSDNLRAINWLQMDLINVLKVLMGRSERQLNIYGSNPHILEALTIIFYVLKLLVL